MGTSICLKCQNFLIFPLEKIKPHYTKIKEETAAKIYIFKKNITECTLDYKVYAFVIFGSLLHAAAIITGIISTLCLFTAGPISLLGFIPTTVMTLYGHYILKQNVRSDPHVFSTPLIGASPASRVMSQPLGLMNVNANCWINASLQCILHIPALRERASKIPRLQQFIQKYLDLQNKGESMSASDMGDLNHFLTSEMQMMRRNEYGLPGQADANVFFEWILGQYPLYEFTQYRVDTRGELYTAQHNGELIRLDIWPHLSFLPSFKHFLLHRTDDRGEIRRCVFNTLPDMLAFSLKRYWQDPYTLQYMHIPNPIEGIDNIIHLPPEATLDGQTGNYMCNAFIVHSGSFGGGHYIAYVKKDGKWWCCNDSSILEVPEVIAIQQMKNAYLIFANKMS